MPRELASVSPAMAASASAEPPGSSRTVNALSASRAAASGTRPVTTRWIAPSCGG